MKLLCGFLLVSAGMLLALALAALWFKNGGLTFLCGSVALVLGGCGGSMLENYFE